MKNFYRFSIVLLPLITLLFIGYGLVSSLRHDAHQTPNFSKDNIVIARLKQGLLPMKEKSDEQQQQSTRLLPRKPSPLDRPSKEELLAFHEVTVVESAEVDGPEPGEKTRMRLLKIPSKYPMLRTEEIIDIKNNSVSSRAEMAADHFLVTLAPGEDPHDFFNKMGSYIISMTQVTEESPLYRVDLASASLDGLPKALQQSDLSTGGIGEPDLMIHGRDAESTVTPNNRLYQCQWALLGDRNYEQHQSYKDDGTVSVISPWHKISIAYGINAPAAWKIRTDASAVVVAVVDSGIRYTHESLAANIWKNPSPSQVGDLHGWNAYDDSGDPMDDCIIGHGTRSAGIIGAVGNNGIGVCGVAWKVQLMACKYLNKFNHGFESDEIVSLDYARTHGAQIVNCSFGGLFWSWAEYEAFKRLHDAGVIVVCAALEGYSQGDQWPIDVATEILNYPSAYQLDNIVSVTALSEQGQLCDFCNIGPTTIGLAAPGEWILSTSNESDSAYGVRSGTSYAAPFVTGALALLKAQFPKETYQELIARLFRSVDLVPSLKGKIIMGGTLNVAKALTGPTPTKGLFYHPQESWGLWIQSLSQSKDNLDFLDWYESNW